jgi:hypothetical protein
VKKLILQQAPNNKNEIPRKKPQRIRKRKTEKTADTTLIQNVMSNNHRVLIGVPTLGIIRMEWAIHRHSQTIPINFQVGTITVNTAPPSVVAMGYSTPDAQNVIVSQCVKDGYSYCILWEDDTMPPFDALIRLSAHMERGEAPIVSGLYFTKGNPSWPLVFRGRGNSCYRNWKMGDLVWCDGFPTGFIMFHGSILNHLWENSPTYKLPDGTETREVFKFPRDSWFDPEQDRYFAQMGTSDLHVANRIIQEEVLQKTGWDKVAKRKYPFLVDTNIFCHHICLENGAVYPQAAQEVFGPTGK